MKSVLTLVAVFATFVTYAHATDWYVHPGQSIQVAINAAHDGDRVLVHPGTYSGGLRLWGKAIVVQGLAGAGSTSIDGVGLPFPAVSFVDGETSASVLEGFTVVGGRDPSTGGAANTVSIASSGPTIRQCVLRNEPSAYGYTLSSSGGSAVLESVQASIDASGSPGTAAVYVSGGSIQLVGCDISVQVAFTEVARCLVANSATVNAVDCSFSGGRAAGCDVSGAGVYVVGSTVSATGCVFADNKVNVSCDVESGGAGVAAKNSTVQFRDCDFVDNRVQTSAGYQFGRGGAVLSEQSQLTIEACAFSNNGGEFNASGWGGSTSGRDVYSNGTLAITDCTFAANNTSVFGPSCLRLIGSGLVDRCVLAEKSTNAIYATSCNLAVTDSLITSANIAVYVDAGSLVMKGTLVAQCEYAVYPSNLTATLTNCTVAHCTNSAPMLGSFVLKNTIVWGNAGLSGFSASASYSDIQGGWSGMGNLNSDPMFADPAGLDYTLIGGSPCIDAGDPGDPVEPDGTVVDIGAKFYLPQVIAYGAGKTNSVGKSPSLHWTGTPTVAANDFTLAVVDAVPSKPGLVFFGFASASLPFHAGTLYVQPPVTRLDVVVLDASGALSHALPLDSSWVGSTRYFQFWYRDPSHPDGTGVGLSSAIMATFAP